MMRDKGKLLKFLVCFTSVIALNSLHAQYLDLEPEETEGVVRGLDYERNIAVIGGLSYYVPADALVEIRGTYGAFTLLEKGMKVSILYYRISDSRREIVKLIQLSDNRRMDEH